jgi:S1-C subfamily serine protease
LPYGSSITPNVTDYSKRGAAIAQALGVKLTPVEAADSNRPQLENFRGGLKVTELVPNSAAANAGVHVGDVIVGIGKYETLSLASLRHVINNAGAQPATLTLRRNGATYSTQIALRSEP